MDRISSFFRNLPPLFAGGSTPTRMMVVVFVVTLFIGLGAILFAIAWVLTPTPTPTSALAKNPPLVFPTVTPVQQIDVKQQIEAAITPTNTLQPPPSPTAVPEATKAQRKHLVQRGENLFRISLRYGVPMEAIVAVNNIKNPALIYAGQVLIIPDAP
jgi:LysM repeat protein